MTRAAGGSRTSSSTTSLAQIILPLSLCIQGTALQCILTTQPRPREHDGTNLASCPRGWGDREATRGRARCVVIRGPSNTSPTHHIAANRPTSMGKEPPKSKAPPRHKSSPRSSATSKSETSALSKSKPPSKKLPHRESAQLSFRKDGRAAVARNSQAYRDSVEQLTTNRTTQTSPVGLADHRLPLMLT